MISKADAENRARAERLIDRHIQSAEAWPIWVQLDEICRASRVMKRLADAYEEGGWTVRWESGDQRDPGSHMVLS